MAERSLAIFANWCVYSEHVRVSVCSYSIRDLLAVTLFCCLFSTRCTVYNNFEPLMCVLFLNLFPLSVSRWLIHVVTVCVCVGAYHVVCMMLHFIITLGALAFKLANNACTLFIHILRWCCWWSRFFLSFSLSPLVHYLYLILQLAACVNAFW